MKRSHCAAVICFGFIVLWAASAFSRPFRTDQIPNNEWSCTTCHITSRGGPRNSFGQQVENTLASNGDVQWSEIYDMDADGDGYTNGEELGDPEGEWEIGDPDPDFDPSHPAKIEETPCKNGSNAGTSVCGSTGIPDAVTGDITADTEDPDSSDGISPDATEPEETSAPKPDTASDDDVISSDPETDASGETSTNSTGSTENNGCGCSQSGKRPPSSFFFSLLIISGLLLRRRFQ